MYEPKSVTSHNVTNKMILEQATIYLENDQIRLSENDQNPRMKFYFQRENKFASWFPPKLFQSFTSCSPHKCQFDIKFEFQTPSSTCAY